MLVCLTRVTVLLCEGCFTDVLVLLQAFEESQGKLDEELATRTAREIALREEAEAKKAAEEAERR